jgi:hypothetical protein
MFIYGQITLGEMVAYLPIPGSFFALANRILNPSIVLSYCDDNLMPRDLRADGCIGSRMFLLGFPA